MRKLAVVVAFLLLFGAQEAQAQIKLGGQASWASDRFDGVAGIGGRVALSLGPFPVEVHGTADYYFPDCAGDCTYWEAGGNAVLRIPTIGSPLRPFLGAGFTYQSSDVDGADASETGLNMIGGVELAPVPVLRPFLEIRYQVMDEFENQFVVALGLIF